MTFKKINYYQPDDPCALARFQNDLLAHLQKKCKKNQPLVLICIGSDRATGDWILGPLVGQSLIDSPVYSVYGSLQSPVHAKNLDHTIELIYTFHKNPFVIAIVPVWAAKNMSDISLCLPCRFARDRVYPKACLPSETYPLPALLTVFPSPIMKRSRQHGCKLFFIWLLSLQKEFRLLNLKLLNLKFHIAIFDQSLTSHSL